MDNQMPDGANLRETKLDRNTFAMIVKCGLPGTGMPPFDKFAYSDGRCYGKTAADLKTYELIAWFGTFAPAGTPRDVIARLNDAVRRSAESLGGSFAISTAPGGGTRIEVSLP